MLEELRAGCVPALQEVVVSVDPTRADSPSDECGIIVAGRGEEGLPLGVGHGISTEE